jgi:hypothetical protein
MDNSNFYHYTATQNELGQAEGLTGALSQTGAAGAKNLGSLFLVGLGLFLLYTYFWNE